MAQSVNLRLKGLYQHPNPLSAVPEGSLLEADNVVIDRSEVAEPRRGFKQYGNTFGISTDFAKQLLTYKDVVIRHVLTELQYDSDGAGNFQTFTDANNVEEITAGLRLKYLESNGNLYIATKDGVKKISARSAADLANSFLQEAGGPKALDVTTELDYTTVGFLTGNSKVAYRVVWGYTDNNDNLILGAVSSRSVVFNAASNSCNVKLTFAVPFDVDSTNFIYQVYRTGVFVQSPSEIDPGDEMQLVIEDNVTATDLTNGFVQVDDITPEEFRKSGAFLYTNPSSGDGIESSNEKPPFAKDIALYKNVAFYANTSTVQRLNFSFLSIIGLGPTNTKTISISDGTTTNTYTFQGSQETYTADFTGVTIGDLHNGSPATAKYFTLTSANDEIEYVVWYNRNPVNDLEPSVTGAVNIEVDIGPSTNLSEAIDATIAAINAFTGDFNIIRTLNVLAIKCSNNGPVTISPTETISGPFTIVKDGLGTGEDAANNKIFLPYNPSGGPGDVNGPTPSQQLEQVARSFVRVVNLQDNIAIAYYTSSFDDIDGQVLLEQKNVVGPAFFLTSNAGSQFNPTLPTSGSSVISTNEVSPNRIYFSKFQQPEAVPLANYIDVGPKDRAIQRVIALRDSLFILKEDGIYRLSGETAPFSIAPFDFSAQILAPDSAVILNNQIYAYTTQGVVVITDTGVQVISRPIENILLSVLSKSPVFRTVSFGVSYESDRSYLLWLPTTANDQVATQCLRFNTFTQTWTRWPIAKTCGIVNFGNDKLYLGAGDANFIEEERKTLTRDDQADREYNITVQLDSVVDKTVQLSNINLAEPGDVLVQTQYVTGSQYDRILRKLDIDTYVNDSDYFATLAFVPGIDMRTRLVLLAQKLDADLGVSDTDYASVIGDYTYSATAISAASQTVITIGTHDIKIGRYVAISGSNSTPSIDGVHQVIAIGANTITINKAVTVAGTTATVQTDVNDFRDMQVCFNLIVNKLNNDPGVFFSNYPISSGTVQFEMPILEVKEIQNKVTVPSDQDLIFGDIVLYKTIPIKLTWNQQFFGDPSTEKQIREAKVLFENKNFTNMEVSFATDRSPNFEGNTFDGLGNGDFGQFDFGTVNFGGVAAPIPIRTYLPRNKQRAIFMFVRIEHNSARETFALFGMSLTVRPYNIRTNR